MGLQIPASTPTGIYHDTISVHGLFSVNAGPTTVYFLGQMISGDIRVCDMQLTVVFFPTAYGPVEPNNPIPSKRSEDEKHTTAISTNKIYDPVELEIPSLLIQEMKQMRLEIESLRKRLDLRENQ